MPMMPPKACDFSGCRNLALPGKWLCATHSEKAAPAYDKYRANTAARKLVNSKAWRDLTGACQVRNPICQAIKENGQQCTNRSHLTHHIRDHHGDTRLFFDWANLVALCDECHASDPASMAKKQFVDTVGLYGETYSHGATAKPFDSKPEPPPPLFYVSGL